MYLATLVRAYAAWRRNNLAMQQLSELDERTLRDLGISRTQIRAVVLHGR
jgi:uncharacterized protein YjiS (DUF1127 family)